MSYYVKNPDVQPGKPNQVNVTAIENQLTGGAQPIYGTGQSQTAYGPSFSGGQDKHSSNVTGDKVNSAYGNFTTTIGSDKAVPPHLFRRAGVSSAQDLQSVRPSSQAIASHFGIWQP